jgi:RND family efflux transporter MFP subunit
VLTERRGIVAAPDGGEPQGDGAAHVGYPIEVAGRLCAVVVLDVGAGPYAHLQEALRQVHWASAWLVDHFRTRLLLERDAELARVATLNELLASALQHRRLQPSAFAVANELANRLACDRVSVGFEEHGHAVPLALSHTATFDVRSDLLRAIADAMNEVLDLGVAVSLPAPEEDQVIAITHAEVARTLKSDAMLSVPLRNEEQTIGVMTLERSAGPSFNADEQVLVRALGVMLGPVWVLQRANERAWWRRLGDAGRNAVQEVFGPRHPGWKLLTGLTVLAFVVVSFVEIDHRVSARTVIEGATQLASVAPFEGFIADSFARAGDTVKRGQPLARLDDRDLKLERSRWTAESEQLQRKLQVSMAQADRAAMGVLAAQIAQAEAQLSLAEEKLARATLIAPFDGVVVSGDLSQNLGTPVEQGKLLFEVAPLEGFRVVLQVDDRDIARVATQQRGELLLSGLPDRTFPFTVSSVTPVASQHEGRNVFRVEAKVDADRGIRLRPGMEGIGKVVVGERSLLWIWTHTFVDWLRVTVWNWMP